MTDIYFAMLKVNRYRNSDRNYSYYVPLTYTSMREFANGTKITSHSRKFKSARVLPVRTSEISNNGFFRDWTVFLGRQNLKKRVAVEKIASAEECSNRAKELFASD